MKLVNNIFVGAKGRETLIDFEEPVNMDYKDIIVFIHGYKGFKDWGAWHLAGKYFVQEGFAFCKFNQSHNGGTTSQPIDFPDLEAFSENKYSYGVEDISKAIDWLSNHIGILNKRIHLVGHSRGGGLAILGAKDPRVHSVVTWASISSIGDRFPSGIKLRNWEEMGYYVDYNGRTKQEMPVKYSVYEDWLENKDMLDIEANAKKLGKSTLHLHGDIDETVFVSDSEKLSTWTGGKLIIIKDAGHTFNTYHPYDKEEMPNKLHEACVLTSRFIEKL